MTARSALPARAEAAALKRKQLEREIRENVLDENALASMIHTLDKLWSFMVDAADESCRATSKELRNWVHDNLASQARGLWIAGDINASDTLSNALDEVRRRWPTQTERLTETKP